MQTGSFARVAEPQVGDLPRAITWVLFGWTVTVGLWILAEILPFEQCPYGQDCDRAPALTNGTTIAGWILVWLAGIAILLLVVWRDRQQP